MSPTTPRPAGTGYRDIVTRYLKSSEEIDGDDRRRRLNHNFEVPGPIEGKDEGELYVSVPYGSAKLAGSANIPGDSANILRNGLYKIEPRSLVSGNTFEHAYVGSIGHLNRGTSPGAVTHVDVFTADHDSNEHTIRPASAYQFTPTSTHMGAPKVRAGRCPPARPPAHRNSRRPTPVVLRGPSRSP